MPEQRHIPQSPQQDRYFALRQQIAQQNEEVKKVQREGMEKVDEQYGPSLYSEYQNQHQELGEIPDRSVFR